MNTEIKYIVIDLFCGAGGTTTGYELAKLSRKETRGKSSLVLSRVVACINHDPIAIKSHWCNHPNVEHFDVCKSKRALAIKYGAKPISWMEMGRKIHGRKLNQDQTEKP